MWADMYLSLKILENNPGTPLQIVCKVFEGQEKMSVRRHLPSQSWLVCSVLLVKL